MKTRRSDMDKNLSKHIFRHALDTPEPQPAAQDARELASALLALVQLYGGTGIEEQRLYFVILLESFAASRLAQVEAERLRVTEAFQLYTERTDARIQELEARLTEAMGLLEWMTEESEELYVVYSWKNNTTERNDSEQADRKVKIEKARALLALSTDAPPNGEEGGP
jgi:hypothetical protein